MTDVMALILNSLGLLSGGLCRCGFCSRGGGCVSPFNLQLLVSLDGQPVRICIESVIMLTVFCSGRRCNIQGAVRIFRNHSRTIKQDRVLDKRTLQPAVHLKRALGSCGQSVVSADIALVVDAAALCRNGSFRKYFRFEIVITESRNGQQTGSAAYIRLNQALRHSEMFVGEILMYPGHYGLPEVSGGI